jgi:glycosyltransferase involved in cell wall biosynthesis
MRVACVIPAYNEEKRIRSVLDVVTRCKIVNEVIVVSDGSSDGTFSIARSIPGVRVYALPKNVGKGAAMRAGASLTNADILLFLDADLIRLTPDHVGDLVRPVLSGEVTMAIGKFRGGRFLTDLAQAVSPNISGQRAVQRDCFLRVPKLTTARMDVEVRINMFARSRLWKIRTVPLYGVTHPLKEEKLGFVRGAWSRAKMYRDIAFAVVFDRQAQKETIDIEAFAAASLERERLRQYAVKPPN